MKNLTAILSLLFLLCSSGIFAQADSTKSEKHRRPIEDRKNELKLGAVKLIAGPILDIEYERVLSKYSSLGGNVVANLNNGNTDYNFSVSPYFRIYFTQNREYGTKGFFVQAFMGYYNGTGYDYNYDLSQNYFQTEEKNWNSFDAGLSAGGKWVNKQGFVFQLVLGIGRKIIGNDYAQDIVFQSDAYIGYRF